MNRCAPSAKNANAVVTLGPPVASSSGTAVFMAGRHAVCVNMRFRYSFINFGERGEERGREGRSGN